MIAKLIINEIDVEIVKEIPISLNYAIADIRDLSKRGGSGSKTLVLSGTQSVNRLFENIFNTNIELGTFDPNVKEEAIYYLNEKEQIKGDLQLLKIILKPNGSVEYNCNLIGREGSLFVAIGDKFLTNIDFSNLDHTFNKTEQKNSWATSYRLGGVATAFAYGSGYVYPFIKYGYAASDSSFDVNHFKPAIFRREYLLRIFTAAGFTWTSAFLDGAFFKRLVTPCNRDKMELSNAAISNSQYYIGKTTATTIGWFAGNTVGNVATRANAAQAINYDLEAVPYFDASNQYDSAVNFYATIGFTGVYNVVAYIKLNITLQCAAAVGGTWTVSGPSNNPTHIWIERNTGSGWTAIAYQAVYKPNGTVTAVGSASSYVVNAQSGNVNLNAGDLIRVRCSVAVVATVLDAASVPVPNGTAFTLDLSIPNGTTNNAHYLLRTDTAVYDGNTLTMNNTIPQNIKQKDYLMDIIQEFNLYIEKDKTNDKNYIIEPRDTFYTANVENWTDKIDYRKDWEVIPMGDLDARNYVWKYKDDKDYYNDLYQKQFIDNYGLKRYQVANDFIKAEKKTEVISSPTPLVSNSSNNIICPHIYTKDGVNLKTIAHNIRSLYYGGLKNSGNTWAYTSLSGTTNETQYPYAGHVDDPLAPTIDLNFDFPKQVYYNYPLAFYTNNNLFNAYYSKFINEITDKDSKIIVCSVRLTELDILKFTFRNKVFVQHPLTGGTFYVVNKIIDYNPLVSETTKVELLKLKNYSAFVPANIPIDVGASTGPGARIGYNPETNAYANNNDGNTLALGSSNRVMGAGNLSTGGERNYIDETSSKVTLINCKEVSVVGVTNFIGIGLSNREITSVYNNMTLDGTKEVWETKTADFDVVPGVDGYYIDCTAGDVGATFTFTNSSKTTVNFIRIDSSANSFRITEILGAARLQGATVPINLSRYGMLQWASIPINNDGTNFFIV
jgi:hypothetical protein